MAGEVVLGYDGEPGSRRAANRGRDRGAFKRPLVIAFGYAPAPIGGAVADLSKAVQELGEKITADAVKLAHDIDATVTTQVELVNDRPAEAILRAADQYDALAIVVGAAGTGPDRRRAARIGHLPGGTPVDAPSRGSPFTRCHLTAHERGVPRWPTSPRRSRAARNPGSR